MMEQLLLASPMAIIVIGAFFLLLISHSKRFNLDRLNLIAVFFLILSSVVQFVVFNANSIEFLFSDIFGETFILDTFSRIFDLMFTIGAILTLLINNDYFKS